MAGDHVLVLDDVEPLVVLAPDLDLGSDQGEPDLLVQADAPAVLADDPRDEGVVARVLGGGDQLAHQELSHAAPAGVAVDVDRVLHGRGVGRPAAKGRDDGETDDPVAPGTLVTGLVLVVHGHDARVRGLVLDDPTSLLVQGARHEVEGVGGLENLGIVDGHQGRGVVDLDQAGSHR